MVHREISARCNSGGRVNSSGLLRKVQSAAVGSGLKSCASICWPARTDDDNKVRIIRVATKLRQNIGISYSPCGPHLATRDPKETLRLFARNTRAYRP